MSRSLRHHPPHRTRPSITERALLRSLCRATRSTDSRQEQPDQPQDPQHFRDVIAIAMGDPECNPLGADATTPLLNLAVPVTPHSPDQDTQIAEFAAGIGCPHWQRHPAGAA